MNKAEIASRYANALFDIANEAGKRDHVFSEIRAVSKIYSSHKELQEFASSPLITPAEKQDLVNKIFVGKGLSEIVEKFLLLLTQKNRLSLFEEVVKSYQTKSDDSNQVTRGQVVSANVLSPEERTELEATVRKVTGKKVILSYEEKEDMIGGLVAKVGSYTFDDSLTSHLKRLQEDIKRRAH
jgi:F-type H+-transporting ATPase subunit delta